MMQERLTTLLGPAVSNRVYPVIATQATLIPYIVYLRVLSAVENILDGNGNPPINITRMQLDIWATSYASAQSVAAAVRALMLAWVTQNVNNGEQDLYDSETRLHRVMMDYSISHYD
jgi:hypothetical protein